MTLNTSDTWLDRMRGVTDPLVDELIREHAARRGAGELQRLLGELFAAVGLPESDPLVADYQRALPTFQLRDSARVERGQELFELFGPEALLVLGSYALPLAYAAGNGVQAIARARRLKDDPIRRLCDTAQMVVGVMTRGALLPQGAGVRAAHKVRLIHGLVRHHLRAQPGEPWSDDWGAPINQEDLAGTLLSFSLAVLDGLRRMGAPISRAEGDDYIFAWAEVGRLLGVDESLLPNDELSATPLALRIGARQIRGTPEGAALTRQLLQAVESLFPLPGYATSLTQFFLKNTVFGPNVAGALALPDANWTRWLVQARAAQKRATLELLEYVPGARRRRSFIARRFAQAMILLRRPDGRVPFEVTQPLLGKWCLAPPRASASGSSSRGQQA